jgi:hypothetical protein
VEEGPSRFSKRETPPPPTHTHNSNSNVKFARGWIPLVRERRGPDGINACVYLGVGGEGGAEAGGEEEQLLPLGVRRADAQHLHFFLPFPERAEQ